MAVIVRFAGLTFLYTKTTKADKKQLPLANDTVAAEVALLDPNRKHAHPDDLKDAGSHLPLLIVQTDDIDKVEGPDERYPLEGAVRASWLGANDLAGFSAWSLGQSVVTLLGDDEKDVKPVLGTPTRTAKGCNSDTTDWTSLEWIPSANVICPGLELAPYWRESPHVSSRFVMGDGHLRSGTPIEANSGLIPIQLVPEQGYAAYSDVIEYEKTLLTPAIAVTRAGSRTLISFDKSDVVIWVLSLDDPYHSTPSFDHFSLYSLLPWRFRVPTPHPSDRCNGYNTTGGECFGLRFDH